VSRDDSGRLIRALTLYFGPMSAIDHRTTKWSSATFTGTRHAIWFDMDLREDLDDLLKNLPEVDLPMPGHFVADIELAERHDNAGIARIGLRALTIAEA
jgi:hypothetical protein